MAFQPASARLQTKVVATGASTTAVVSQNFLRASARSKTSVTQIDSLHASYPIKLISTAPSSTTFVSPAEVAGSATSTTNGEKFKVEDEDKESALSLSSNQKSSRPQLPPPPRIVYMITYGGGLLADDHADLQIVLQRHARLLILGQGYTKIYKSLSPDHPPASQTLHSTVAPGAFFLFLGPPVVACENSSVFLRHEVLLQAQRKMVVGLENGATKSQMEDDEDELPNCVVLDWITGGRGEEERWKARRTEWRMIVRWAELEPENSPSLATPADPTKATANQLDQKEEEEEEEYVEEEDPRDVADRLAGGPVIFRDGFLIEDNPRIPSKSTAAGPAPVATSEAPSPSTSSTLRPKITSYASSLYPHSAIGSLFIMGPKTKRLQQSILKRFEQLAVYPGQKPEQRADYPILWSVTVVQVSRPPVPNQCPLSTSTTSSVPKRKHTKMNAMVVKMASQGIEQMQTFLKSLFEEQGAELDNRKNMMDSDDDEEDQGRENDHHGGSKSNSRGLTDIDGGDEGLSVVDELFGGRTVYERVLR
ncbi:hypothetical protein BGZ58_008383 [Dissophora ornata]|nr:hypothetical protein BGZ58_008383 [Dissophora ornata]